MLLAEIKFGVHFNLWIFSVVNYRSIDLLLFISQNLLSHTFVSFRFKKYLESSKEELFEIGFPKFTTEDFHDMVSTSSTIVSLSGESLRVAQEEDTILYH